MTTSPQPEALRLAARLEDTESPRLHLMPEVATLLRTQHAEIERLNAAIKWEQNRAERIGTHGPGCEKWGPAHFECAVRAMERKGALLRQALKALEHCHASEPIWKTPRIEAVDAIKQELSQ